MYIYGYIDENVINEVDAINGICDGGWDCEMPATDVQDLLFPSQDLIETWPLRANEQPNIILRAVIFV